MFFSYQKSQRTKIHLHNLTACFLLLKLASCSDKRFEVSWNWFFMSLLQSLTTHVRQFSDGQEKWINGSDKLFVPSTKRWSFRCFRKQLSSLNWHNDEAKMERRWWSQTDRHLSRNVRQNWKTGWAICVINNRGGALICMTVILIAYQNQHFIEPEFTISWYLRQKYYVLF